jgi:hypothetical protein
MAAPWRSHSGVDASMSVSRKVTMPWGSSPGWRMAPSYSQPALRAILMASMRLRPPTLAMALER